MNCCKDHGRGISIHLVWFKCKLSSNINMLWFLSRKPRATPSNVNSGWLMRFCIWHREERAAILCLSLLDHEVSVFRVGKRPFLISLMRPGHYN